MTSPPPTPRRKPRDQDDRSGDGRPGWFWRFSGGWLVFALPLQAALGAILICCGLGSSPWMWMQFLGTLAGFGIWFLVTNWRWNVAWRRYATQRLNQPPFTQGWSVSGKSKTWTAGWPAP